MARVRDGVEGTPCLARTHLRDHGRIHRGVLREEQAASGGPRCEARSRRQPAHKRLNGFGKRAVPARVEMDRILLGVTHDAVEIQKLCADDVGGGGITR